MYRVLDLFCGAGGAAVGLKRAWPDAEIIGVDNRPQKHYPFTFLLADALTFPLDGFDFIWASPPCQAYSLTTGRYRNLGYSYPDLIGRVRQRLIQSRTPFVIENVVGAPLLNAITLCGVMFALRVIRHRKFESNLLLLAPAHSKHPQRAARPGKIPLSNEYWSPVGKFGRQDDAQRSMGITWMENGVHNPTEIAQAVPPAYSEYIARQIRPA